MTEIESLRPFLVHATLFPRLSNAAPQNNLAGLDSVSEKPYSICMMTAYCCQKWYMHLEINWHGLYAVMPEKAATCLFFAVATEEKFAQT
jgi:hypothetical protein